MAKVASLKSAVGPKDVPRVENVLKNVHVRTMNNPRLRAAWAAYEIGRITDSADLERLKLYLMRVWVEETFFSMCPLSHEADAPVDAGQVSSRRVGGDAFVKGGIDLNDPGQAMEIRKDVPGPIPVNRQDVSNISLDGLVPQILSIEPVVAGSF